SRGDYPTDEKHDDKSDVGQESEKLRLISTVASPARECYSPVCREMGYWESERQHSLDDELPAHPDAGNNLQCFLEANSPQPCRPLGHELNTSQINHTSANNKVSYDSFPFIERGVNFSSSYKAQPSDGEMEHSFTRRRDTPQDKLRQSKTNHKNHYNARNVVQSEVHCLLKENNKYTTADTDDTISWHDIGNSLDRTFFWVFFLVTNTVTVVILVLFVKSDP
ncbi:unnamed protein product, partial [Candidula unifasciata]